MDPESVDELRSSGQADTAGQEGCDADSSDDAAAGTQAGLGAGRVPHGGAEDPMVLDFSSNTNPQRPDGLAPVYEAALSGARSYPPDDYCEFRATVAEYVGCEATDVIPTAGGLAALRIAIATTVEAGDRVLVPKPSFGEYAREVRLQGGEPQFFPATEILRTDPEDVELVIVCNPNNPTGEAYDPGELRSYADRCLAAGTPLLVDEAFIDFTDHPSLAGREGVIVARSLTKLFGLPGLRAGFAVATGRYRDRLDTARMTWGLGSVAACVGIHCLGETEFVERTRERVESERERMAQRLEARFDVHPSDAPFLLLDAGSSDAVDEVVATVRSHDIAVRDARSFRGLDQHIRVAVRLPHENDLLLDALDV